MKVTAFMANPKTLRRNLGTSALLLLGVLCFACVSVEPEPDFDRARRLIAESTGHAGAYDPREALTDLELDTILDAGLSLEEALRIALANNRDLQADFQTIGIAHADWVQAQLLSNPSLDVLLRFPSSGGRSVLEAALTMQLLELWQVPARKAAAEHHLEATVLRIARRAGELLTETRQAYHAAAAAEALHRVAEESALLAAQSREAVQNLHRAGAADALEENLAHGPLLAAQLLLHTTRIEAAEARRDLARKLSIGRSVQDWQLTDPLPSPPREELDPEALVEQALVSRLDLRAMRVAIDAVAARLGEEQRRAFGDLAAGPTAERSAEKGDDLVGGALQLTLPLFDQNQAQVARAGFQLEQLVKLYDSARVAVAQDVRSAVDRRNTALRSLALYRDELLPQAERSLALARVSYASGRTSLLALVEVQRQLLDARRGHVTLLREAALSEAELESVVGAIPRKPRE